MTVLTGQVPFLMKKPRFRRFRELPRTVWGWWVCPGSPGLSARPCTWWLRSQVLAFHRTDHWWFSPWHVVISSAIFGSMSWYINPMYLKVPDLLVGETQPPPNQTFFFFFLIDNYPVTIHFLQAVFWSVFEEKRERFMVLVSKNHWEGMRPSFCIIDIWQSVNSVFSSGALVCYFVYSLNS